MGVREKTKTLFLFADTCKRQQVQCTIGGEDRLYLNVFKADDVSATLYDQKEKQVMVLNKIY